MDYGTHGARVGGNPSAHIDCGNCGEPTEGRYCRMCGTPVGTMTGVGDGQTALSALPGYGASTEPTQMAAAQGYGGGYGATQLAAPQMQAGAPAGYGAGAESTQQISPMHEPTAPTQPPSEFDSLFRTPDGSPGAHGQTQLLPPVVEADYLMEPPGGQQPPPGAPRGPREDDESRTNRMVVFVTVGAVLVAAGVILGLLYLGNQGSSTNASSSSTATSTAGAAHAVAASQGPGTLQIPTDGATLAQSTAPASSAAASTSAAAAFHGDDLPLGPGSSGSKVKWVQEQLKQLGYYHGSTSGDFDQATALAVQQFQAAAGVTGDAASTVGQHTLVALAAAGSTPDLTMGTRSSDVSRLNQALNYAEGTQLSGSRYSTQTAAAVAAYQLAVGLTPTGQVDGSTWAKLQTGTLGG